MIALADVIVEAGGTRIVDGVSWAAAAGEAWALVGRTGSGRTTLLEAIAGLVPLAAGDAIIGGHSARREARLVRRLVGHVPAGIVARPALRAGEFLELGAAAVGLSGTALAGAVERGLAMAGLAGGGQERLDRLPDGIVKRLLIARALVADPPVVVFDDPFRALDPRERREVEHLVADLVLVERTVVAALDDASVPPCFTHVAALRGGRIVARGAASPAAFPGRTWPVRFVVPGRAEEAAAILGAGAVARDADALVASLAGEAEIAVALAALVEAGIGVVEARHDGPWAARLLDD